MKSIVESLFELQTLLLAHPADGSKEAAQAAALRRSVPNSLLGHFDRRIARGRRAAAQVRHGVCGECHMRLPLGTAASLVAANNIVLCETCSCYLMLAPDEAEAIHQQIEESKRRRAAKLHLANPSFA